MSFSQIVRSLAFVLLVNCFSYSNAQVVTTLAGSSYGYVDGTGTAARFSTPADVAVDLYGNVYVADERNHRIRKITPGGVVSTLAGSNGGFLDGTGTSAKFAVPTGVATDASGNVYVADKGNHKIRKITATGVVTTIAGSTSGFADGTGASAKFSAPSGLIVDASGNIFVADGNNHRIRKITPTGVVTTVAGSTSGYVDGIGSLAKFTYPSDVDVDASGNLYVTDRYNNRIRKITTSGVVTTIAGSTSGFADGTGTSAQFNHPNGITLDPAKNMYVSGFGNNRIRRITPLGVVTTIAGSIRGYQDGAGTTAKFYLPIGIDADKNGNLYVADWRNSRIRKITGIVTCSDTNTTRDTISADVCDAYESPSGKTWTSSNTYHDTIANQVGCDSIITINLTIRTKSVDTVRVIACDTFISPTGKVWRLSGTYYDTLTNAVSCDSIITIYLKILGEDTRQVTTFVGGTYGSNDGTGTLARFRRPLVIITDKDGNIYVGEKRRIRKISPDGVVTSLAGHENNSGYADGTGTAAKFNDVSGLAIDQAGNIYAADGLNQCIRKITPAGVVTTFAGIGGASGYLDGPGS
ncbi:MAG: sugar lactone lactonase YvrE, partial [Bacteroidia bacterium]